MRTFFHFLIAIVCGLSLAELSAAERSSPGGLYTVEAETFDGGGGFVEQGPNAAYGSAENFVIGFSDQGSYSFGHGFIPILADFTADKEPPVITCPGNIEVGNDPGQCGAVVSFSVTATDNRPNVITSCDFVSGSFFPIGTTHVTCTATDAAGNTASCTFDVAVNDIEAPFINCPADIVVQNDPGVCGAVVTYAIPVGADNCPAATTQLTSGLGSGAAFPVGTTTETYTVTDAAGNVADCSFTITVDDTELPTAICQNVTVQLDANGQGSLTTTAIDNGSSDNCGIASLSLDVTSFDCSDVGPNPVTLTVTDDNGNVSTCVATVTVEDNVAPVAICQNITVQLDQTGAASISTADIDNGSSDNCGIATLSLDVTTFDCSDVGSNPVILSVMDNNGNVSTCAATVMVEDNVVPVAVCKSISVTLSPAGTVTITGADIDNGSSDACGIASLVATPNSFTSADIGANAVTLTVTDNHGNTSDCQATVTVAIRSTTLVYSGDGSGQYSDPVILRAVLTDTLSGAPIPGKLIAFTLGNQSISATTDAIGVAATTLTLDQPPSELVFSYTIIANFAGIRSQPNRSGRGLRARFTPETAFQVAGF